jgi:hypothetical protein
MSPTSKYEYLAAIKPRYRNASRSEKQIILDEFCRVYDYNRKYAIRLINTKSTKINVKNLSKRGRKKQYDNQLILEVLTELWITTNLPCSKRLKEIIASIL